MDIRRTSNDLSRHDALHGLAVPHKRAAMPVEAGGKQRPDTVLVSARDEAPSLIPLHALPENAPQSTAPALQPSQCTPAAAEHETVSLANHVSLQIFHTAATRNTKNVMVFLHGGPGLEYTDAYEPLTRSFLANGYTVIAPEIAGSGKEGLKDTSDSYSRNYVRDLKSVIRSLRERPDMQGKEFCVLAHSWGGFQLASLLTDDTAEERAFFKKVAFISPNLDSSQTRLFADAAQYNDATDASILAFKHALIGNFKSRHAGENAEVGGSNEMTVLHNPLIDQSLNEDFSPFYRLDKMPSAIPCLFFHAGDDAQVPLSQSVEAFAKINHAGGNASVIVSSQGGHGFFKTGESHNDAVTASCFSAMDAFFKQSEPSKLATIGNVMLDDPDIGAVETQIREIDQNYENYTKALTQFHNDSASIPENGERKKLPSKRRLLEKIEMAHAKLAERLQGIEHPVARKNADAHSKQASMISDFLKTS